MTRSLDNQRVLAVDLDGTLLRGDLFIHSIGELLKARPLYCLLFPWWLLGGRAAFKREVARRIHLDIDGLAFREEVLAYVRAQKAAGCYTVLATGSDEMLVRPVAARLGCFDEIMASDGRTNRTGVTKSRELAGRFGPGGFDYIGNSRVDIPVWEASANVFLAGSNPWLINRLRRRFGDIRVFP